MAPPALPFGRARAAIGAVARGNCLEPDMGIAEVVADADVLAEQRLGAPGPVARLRSAYVAVTLKRGQAEEAVPRSRGRGEDRGAVSALAPSQAALSRERK